MKSISILALVAALALPGLALAQDVSISAEISTSAEVSVSTPDLSSAVSDVSSAVSSASSELSGEVSSALSAEASSEMSASSAMSSGEAGDFSCDTLDTSTMTLTAIDPAALAAVDAVTVFSVNDCTGIGGLAEIDGSAVAALQTHPAVIDALAASGEAGAEIIAYTLDGSSLTVFVRDRA